MKLGIAADHGGYNLKEEVKAWLNSAGHQVKDFGAHQLDQFDDYPDYVIPLARAVASGDGVIGIKIAEELITAFLNARYIGAERHRRRLEKIKALEK